MFNGVRVSVTFATFGFEFTLHFVFSFLLTLFTCLLLSLSLHEFFLLPLFTRFLFSFPLHALNQLLFFLFSLFLVHFMLTIIVFLHSR